MFGTAGDKPIRTPRAAAIAVVASIFAGCAVQTPPVVQKEPPVGIEAQRQAQKAATTQAPAVPTLKRKIALGRITNETAYGQSLLRDRHDDPLGKQVTLKMMSDQPREVVGIVGEVKMGALDAGVDDSETTIYAPLAQFSFGGSQLMVRTTVPPESLTPALVGAVPAIRQA